MANALVEIASGGLAETGGETPLPRHCTELDEVRFAVLDLDEPWQQIPDDVVTDDSTGGKQGCGIEGQEACRVEWDRSLENPSHVPGHALHIGGAVYELDDVMAGASVGLPGRGHVLDRTGGGSYTPGIWGWMCSQPCGMDVGLLSARRRCGLCNRPRRSRAIQRGLCQGHPAHD